MKTDLTDAAKIFFTNKAQFGEPSPAFIRDVTAFAAEQLKAQALQFNDAIPAMKEAYEQGKADGIAEKEREVERLNAMLEHARRIDLWFPNPDEPGYGTNGTISVSPRDIAYHLDCDLPGTAPSIIEAFEAMKEAIAGEGAKGNE